MDLLLFSKKAPCQDCAFGKVLCTARAEAADKQGSAIARSVQLESGWHSQDCTGARCMEECHGDEPWQDVCQSAQVEEEVARHSVLQGKTGVDIWNNRNMLHLYFRETLGNAMETVT